MIIIHERGSWIMKKKEGTVQSVKSSSVPKKKSLWEEIKRNKFFYIIPIPGIIFLLMFCYIPMTGIYVAFENYSYEGGLFGSEFVGLKNFQILFDNLKYVVRATRNTLVINVGSVLLGTVLNVTVACILGEIHSEGYRKTVQAVTIFPQFMSWIVVGVIADALLNDKSGLINHIIKELGGNPISWSVKSGYWWPIIILFSLWKGFGYGSIVYYATLTGFDPAMYEAAEVDGASRFQQITKITIPLLKPTIAIMLLLNIGGVLGGSLDQIMGLTKLNPLLLETTDTITTYIYRSTTGTSNFGLSSAVSLYQSVFGCILVLTANFLAKKLDPDYALF